MDRKCSAGNSHRMMGIVEEAIVLLFLYFSTSASLLMSISILPSTFFLRSISPIPYPASLYVTKCSICLDCIVQAEEEKREKTKDSERERERGRQDEKREIEGMKETNDCGFAGGLDATVRPERRGAGFMLLVHKFSVNGARMSRRPLFCILPPLSSPFPASSRFSRSSVAGSLSLFRSPRFRLLWIRSILVVGGLILPSARSPVCLRERHRTRG